MLYLRSFNRFILISLALLGLSVSSAIASLTSGDSSFGLGSITIDSVSGLEWLDLTYTAGWSYDDVSGNLTGGTWDGWRYATGDEVDAFWANGGSTGTADAWVADVIGLWGTTSGSPFDITATFLNAGTYIGSIGSHNWGYLGDYTLQTCNCYAAESNFGYQLDDTESSEVAHALVRDPNAVSAVPVPAAIWLFGTALIGLVGYGKRKSKVPV